MSVQVDFTPDQEAFVQEAIRSGRLNRAEDAVRQALSLWERDERKRLEILAAFEESEADLESGNYADYTDENASRLAEELKTDARVLRDKIKPMASPVECREHGRQNGALACQHVSDAVWRKTRAPVKYRKVLQDFMGDGTELLPSLLCAKCIEAFGIDPDKILPVEEGEDSKNFPYVAPICAQCLTEYQKVHSA
jgi:Arc/MetJ-type ribon-helix-helix transcriptional regulator